jgi:hypothetical protein
VRYSSRRKRWRIDDALQAGASPKIRNHIILPAPRSSSSSSVPRALRARALSLSTMNEKMKQNRCTVFEQWLVHMLASTVGALRWWRLA